MGFDFKGMKDLQKQLKKIEKQAQLAVNGGVSLGDLFSEGFMRKHTNQEDIHEFIDESPASDERLEDIEQLNTPAMDDYVRNQTKFESWSEFLQAATNDYGAEMLKKAGFKVK